MYLVPNEEGIKTPLKIHVCICCLQRARRKHRLNKLDSIGSLLQSMVTVLGTCSYQKVLHTAGYR